MPDEDLRTGKERCVMVALLKMPQQFGADIDYAERRMFPRKEIHAHVDGKRLDHSLAAHRQPQLALALRDVSLGGLSAISQTALETGERLTVFFPPQGASRGWDAYGRVLRCEPSGFGYRVAVEFDPLPAA
ncbi:MAG: PilZ domain-containing protein [Tepidisphaeraceae bacterium]